MAEAIARRRPDYVVVFPKWLSGLEDDPRFRPVHVLEVPDNITMGGTRSWCTRRPGSSIPLRPKDRLLRPAGGQP